MSGHFSPPPPAVDRHAALAVGAALQDTPVLTIVGPRQAGKSTLAHALCADDPAARYRSLDDEESLLAARRDPATFVRCDGMLVIDEVQRAPELFRALKSSVDRDRRPGRFVLTGSTQAGSIAGLADALVGRNEWVELWPFSRGELEGRRETFIDAMFAGGEAVRVRSKLDRRDYLELTVAGGYPEAVRRETDRRRARWFDALVENYVRADVESMASIERLDQLRRLLALTAARTACLVNYDDLARDAGFPQSTLRRYLALLEATFLVLRLPAWSNNLTTRAVRTPKLHLTDTGLAAHLLGVSAKGLDEPTGPAGQIVETFVAMELRKQIGWCEDRPRLHYFRTKDGAEVDIVIESADGRIAAVEVKAGRTVRPGDFAGMRLLRDKAGKRFVCGVVLHTGENPLSFGDGFWAVPIAALWD